MSVQVGELKAQWQNQGAVGIALDIDETLADIIYYLVNNLMRLFGNPESLTAEAIIKKYRYTHNVPYWQCEEVQEWLNNFRYSNEQQLELPVIPEAAAYVRRLHEKVRILCYITVRPELIRKGTESWLEKHAFPVAPVIHRPAEQSFEQASAWKAQVLHELYPYVQGIVDDNPSIIASLPGNYLGTVYLYNYQQEVSSSLKVVCCADWPTVYESVCGQ